jgi:hypothetical protein
MKSRNPRASFAAVHESAVGTKLPFAAVQNYVRFLGYSGREMLAVRLSLFDPNRTSGWLADWNVQDPLTDGCQFDIVQSGSG